MRYVRGKHDKAVRLLKTATGRSPGWRAWVVSDLPDSRDEMVVMLICDIRRSKQEGRWYLLGGGDGARLGRRAARVILQGLLVPPVLKALVEYAQREDKEITIQAVEQQYPVGELYDHLNNVWYKLLNGSRDELGLVDLVED